MFNWSSKNNSASADGVASYTSSDIKAISKELSAIRPGLHSVPQPILSKPPRQTNLSHQAILLTSDKLAAYIDPFAVPREIEKIKQQKIGFSCKVCDRTFASCSQVGQHLGNVTHESKIKSSKCENYPTGLQEKSICRSGGRICASKNVCVE